MDDSRIRAARLLASSRHAMPIEEARWHIAERRRRLLAGAVSFPEPDFSAPEAAHLADDPEAFARGFLARNPGAGPRKPFDVIPGGKSCDRPKKP